MTDLIVRIRSASGIWELLQADQVIGKNLKELLTGLDGTQAVAQHTSDDKVYFLCGTEQLQDAARKKHPNATVLSFSDGVRVIEEQTPGLLATISLPATRFFQGGTIEKIMTPPTQTESVDDSKYLWGRKREYTKRKGRA